MIRVALAQLDLTVGDIDGNSARITEAIAQGERDGAQIVALPELAVTGYPPEDLVLKRAFVAANRAAVDEIAVATGEALAVVGFVDAGREALFNAAAVCHRGKLLAIYHKHLLPNYGVFDERRYFDGGKGHCLFESDRGVIGVCICEDVWSERGPVVSQGDAGAQLVININASPFHKGKLQARERLLGDRARRARAAIAYVNMVGGQDELVFDGGSMIVGPDGEIVARMPQLEEDFAIFDVPLGSADRTDGAAVQRIPVELRAIEGTREPTLADPLDDVEEIYRALVVALRDYVAKNGFERVVIGLSGGIDSSLTAAIAADALGAERVLGIAMPSEFSSSHSIEDAKQLAANLGIEMLEIPISEPFHAFLEALRGAFGKVKPGLAEENLQARVRGNILMATSNRYGHLVITTGNKSEMACGYATLYGDMAGGFALLKDVFKTEVYELARWRNRAAEAIPPNVLSKPPSAELRANQKDSDSLPPYEILDPILEAYIEEERGIGEIVEGGADRETVEKVVALVDRAEYKRRQAAPGPKVTTKAFGRDRRLPITNKWREGPDRGLPRKVTGEKREK
jgi:NAD+ synthase (glutamine-hydrolysing)